MRLLGNNEVLFEREYYSVGGGFIEWKGWEKPEVGKPIYPYGNMTQLKALMRKNNVNLTEVMMANEKAITGIDEVEINRRIDQLLEAIVRKRHVYEIQGNFRGRFGTEYGDVLI
jgi:L-serine dehydratase